MNGKGFASPRARQTATRSARRRVCLRLEALEDRSVPSTVTNLFDSGTGSLRQAILDTPSGGTVDFQAGLMGTITLTTGELVIAKDLTIAGPGAGVITVSGNDSSRVFDLTSTATVSLTGLTIAHGAAQNGGGVYIAGGTVSISNCILGNNQAKGALGGFGAQGAGGGLYAAAGTVVVTSSMFSANQATGGNGSSNNQGGPGGSGGAGAGGGLYVASGTVWIAESTISANRATGGHGGNATGFGLSAFGGGGGLGTGGGLVVAGGTIDVTNSTISVNQSTGGDGGTGTLRGGTGGRAVGGGVYSEANFPGAVLHVTDSTIFNNQVVGGAGAQGNGNGQGLGGGIDYSGTMLTLTSCTISANQADLGGGIIGSPVAVNTIIAGDTAVSDPDIVGTISSLGHNLIGDGTGGGGYAATDLVGTSDNPIDPKLGPLQDNGGPTPTLALLPDSPAIDAGDNTYAPEWDQRGFRYPRVVNGTIDIGAFEVQNYQTFVVTNTHNAGPGSLRKAILDANANPGDSRIAFDIPGTGVHTIAVTSALPAIAAPVFIDGASQPGFAGSPLIVLTGADAGRGANGFTLTAGHSVVIGLVINDFGGAAIRALDSGGDVVAGNYIGTDATGTRARGNRSGIVLEGVSNNFIGGTDPGSGNLVSGNRQDGVALSGSDNLVEGNRIGTDVTGATALPNLTGVSITSSGSHNTVGGIAPGAGNLISGNRQDGVGIDGGTDNHVQGNFIGTNSAGRAALPNGYGLELFFGSSASVLGGTAAGAGNVIAGNRLDGVGIYSDSNLLQGNFIGTDATGTRSLGNGRNGIAIHAGAYGFNNTIGGTATGAANVVAHNGQSGVLVDRGTGNAIRENRIFDNGGSGIELRHGGNEMQAAPVLNFAYSFGSETTVAGTLTSVPNAAVTLEFFANSDSGSGEGERFLGSLTVSTDEAGQASFTAHLMTSPDLVPFVTATATDPTGNTSAFSASLAVVRTTLTTLDVPGEGGVGTFPRGINASGQIVGFFDDGSHFHGFLLSGGNYTTLDVPGSQYTSAQGINASGQIVGNYVDANSVEHGFLLSGGNYTTLDMTTASGINDAGQIVGESGGHGVLLSGGNYTTLDVPGARTTSAQGINDAGQIVGWYQDAAGYNHGFLLSGGSYTTLDVPGGEDTGALGIGINNSGQIVGAYYEGSVGYGFLLSGGIYAKLSVPGAGGIGTFAQGINDAGQIVGYYIDVTNGFYHGFLATPVITPVRCSVTTPVLWPPDNQLVKVGLSVQVSDPSATVTVQVFANDGALAADAADLAPGKLRLRSDRQGGSTGRVYLIVVTATDAAGAVAFDVCTVVVPHDHSGRSLAAVEQQAADAEAYFLAFHTAPPGYRLLG
jgi:probable HAF family extracellular repeat protein